MVLIKIYRLNVKKIEKIEYDKFFFLFSRTLRSDFDVKRVFRLNFQNKTF